MQVVHRVCYSKLKTFSPQSVARTICLSCGEMNKYAAREGRFMAKVMRTGHKKKKYWSYFENNSVPSTTQMTSASGGKGARRVAVLNKLFMKNITDLMATGEVAAEIVGKGVEISKVKVAPDFNLVNVFWCAKGNEMDEEIEKTLVSVAGQLRHELSQLRVMGVVPKIQFVKDKHYSKTADVERLLQIADYGEDYVPSADGTLRSEFTEDNMLNQRKEEKGVPEDDLLNEIAYPNDDLNLPVMRMDVLGVDHSTIMKKIVRSMNKAKATHRFEGSEKSLDTVVSENVTEQNTEYLTAKQQRLQLNKFLTQRKSLKNKTRTRSSEDLDMLYEKNIPHTSPYSHFLEDDKEEQDYIEDDESFLRRH